MKYKEWLDIWIENTVRPTAKSKTYQRYKEIVRLHLIPKLGEYQLEELSPLVLQKFVTQLLNDGNSKSGDGLSANTVNTVITVAQSSLKSAYEFGQLKEFSANRVRRPKVQEKQISCFSLAHQRKIEQAIENGKRDKMFGVILCLYTGLRIGELLALEWDDIDFDKGLLSVSKSCHYGKSDDGKFRRQTGPPKTLTSCRIIPLPKQILIRLKALKRRSKSVFVVANGANAIAVRSYQRSFELLLKRLGIPRQGFHALRHTFATRALECGMDIKTLSEIMGHKNSSVTLNRYAHSLIDHKKEMMNKVGKLLQ
ncbi:MAG: site-specific integrase [Clostridia bacterium]|nr:site-specific integrase [Clostridia bacterium]